MTEGRRDRRAVAVRPDNGWQSLNRKEVTAMTIGVEEFIRRGIAAQDAADRAAGRRTAAELDREYDIERLRARLQTELTAALDAVAQAARTVAELSSDSVYDVEFSESDTGRDIAHFIDSARRGLVAARGQIPV